MLSCTADFLNVLQLSLYFMSPHELLAAAEAAVAIGSPEQAWLRAFEAASQPVLLQFTPHETARLLEAVQAAGCQPGVAWLQSYLAVVQPKLYGAYDSKSSPLLLNIPWHARVWGFWHEIHHMMCLVDNPAAGAQRLP
jgi:hypothetical protein